MGIERGGNSEYEEYKPSFEEKTAKWEETLQSLLAEDPSLLRLSGKYIANDDVTINLTNGDVNASGMSGTPIVTVNGGVGSNVITTDDGADVINLSSGTDTVSTNAGNDTVSIDDGNLSSADIIDGGANSDTLNVTGTASLADSDFTNITNFLNNCSLTYILHVFFVV